MNILNKSQEAEETDALTTSKRGNRSPSPLDSQDTLTATVMAYMKNADVSWGKYWPKTQTKGEFILTQKMAPPSLATSEEQLEKNSLLTDWG